MTASTARGASRDEFWEIILELREVAAFLIIMSRSSRAIGVAISSRMVTALSQAIR